VDAEFLHSDTRRLPQVSRSTPSLSRTRGLLPQAMQPNRITSEGSAPTPTKRAPSAEEGGVGLPNVTSTRGSPEFRNPLPDGREWNITVGRTDP
jgi:hypothetical protein